MLSDKNVQAAIATPAQHNLQQAMAVQVGYQLLFVLVAVLLLHLLAGRYIAASVFCGAVAYALPAVLCGWWLLRDRCISPGSSLLRTYLVQLVKLTASVLLLCGSIFYMQLAIFPILVAYFVMMLISGLTALVQQKKLKPNSGQIQAAGLHV